MLKKLLKGCLTIAMVSALAIPAMAEGKINGRARGYLDQTSVKDGASILQFGSDARFGGELSGEAGDWTGKGFVQVGLGYNDAKGEVSFSQRDAYVSLSNDSMSILFGRKYAFGVAQGMAYGTGHIQDSYWAGEGAAHARGDYLIVGLKNVGLDVIVGMNNYNAGNDATGDQYQETTFGAKFNKSFGSLDLGVGFTSQSRAIDTEYGDGAVEKSANDGWALSDLGLGIGFALSDTMGLAFNYGSTSTTAGTEGAEAEVETDMEFWFDLGLGDGMGISIGVGSQSVADGSDNATANSMTNVTFKKGMGVVYTYASYISTTSKDDDTGVDSGSSKIGAGLGVNF